MGHTSGEFQGSEALLVKQTASGSRYVAMAGADQANDRQRELLFSVGNDLCRKLGVFPLIPWRVKLPADILLIAPLNNETSLGQEPGH